MLLSAIFSKKNLLKLLLLIACVTPVSAIAEPKIFLITLPVVTIGREGALRAEYNLVQKGTLALEWTEWVGNGKREELTKQEMRDNPGTTLLSEGRELGIMFGRYTDPFNMGGFNWGLGAGYRMVKVNWVKRTHETVSTNQESRENFDVRGEGPTLSGRLGYRFVGEDIGFTIGSFLGAKYFLSQISDHSSEDKTVFSPIGIQDKSSLKRKLGTSLKIGVEIGWAF